MTLYCFQCELLEILVLYYSGAELRPPSLLDLANKFKVCTILLKWMVFSICLVLAAMWHVLAAMWHVLAAMWHVLAVMWHVLAAMWHVLAAMWHVLAVMWHVLAAMWHVSGCNVTCSSCNVTCSGCNVTCSGCNVTCSSCNVTCSGCNVTCSGYLYEQLWRNICRAPCIWVKFDVNIFKYNYILVYNMIEGILLKKI